MRRRYIALLLVFSMLFLLCACGGIKLNLPALSELTSSIESTPSSEPTSSIEGTSSSEPTSSIEGTSSSEPTSSIEGTSSSEAVSSDAYTQWLSLLGYWHAADGRFFALEVADAHSVYFRQGVWETESDSGFCAVENLTLTGETELKGSMQSGEFRINWSDREQDGKIHIFADGQDYQCAFAGMTDSEAYQTYLENIGVE